MNNLSATVCLERDDAAVITYNLRSVQASRASVWRALTEEP